MLNNICILKVTYLCCEIAITTSRNLITCVSNGPRDPTLWKGRNMSTRERNIRGEGKPWHSRYCDCDPSNNSFLPLFLLFYFYDSGFCVFLLESRNRCGRNRDCESLCTMMLRDFIFFL